MPRALFVIDAQEGFLNEHTKPALFAIEKLLQQDWDVIIASQFIGTHGSLFETRLGYKGMLSLIEQELCAAVAKAAHRVFRKRGYSALTPDAQEFLRFHQCSDVHVCGFDTDGCVLATCFSLWDAGYAPILIEEAVASSGGKAMHAAALEIAKRSFGEPGHL